MNRNDVVVIIFVVLIIVVASICSAIIFATRFAARSPIMQQSDMVAHNAVIGFESFYPEIKYNYTVYVTIKNVSVVTEDITVKCDITRPDLTICTKEFTISNLPAGEERTISFFFSNNDLQSQIPIQYKIYSG